MNKQKFNLQIAIDEKRDLVTRSGVTIPNKDWHFFSGVKEYPLHVSLKVGDSTLFDIYRFDREGRYIDIAKDHELDLFMLPKTVTYYVSIVLRQDGSYFACTPRNSIEDCERNEKEFCEKYKFVTRLTFEVEE